MWHEARKQEKAVRKVIVNYRKRAERRQEYYEKIKQDPTKFMQIHGRKCKLHIDETGIASDSNSMMPWQGDRSNMIDRFDVRAHLDYIKPAKSSSEFEFSTDKQERKCSYERYRILVYNRHRGVSESQHLNKIHINETYPELTARKQEAEAKKQLLASTKATIGYTYEEDNGSIKRDGPSDEPEEDEDDDLSSDDEFLHELEDIPPVKELNAAALQDLETLSLEFGQFPGDFTDALQLDQTMQDKMDRAKALDHEKQKMSGKKSRRERRMLKDNRLRGRVIGPLSYVLRDEDVSASEPGSSSDSDSSSDSSDRSPRCQSAKEDDGAIEFITSFGDHSNKAVASAAPPPGSVKAQKPTASRSKPRRRSRSRSRSRSRRSTSRDRRWRSRSRSRERKSYRRQDRSYSRRSRSPGDRRRRSRSRGRRSSSRERHRRSRSRDRRSRSSERRRISRSRSRSPKKPFATVKSTSSSQPSAAAAGKKMTPQERLKIKMQRALKKQLKADRLASADKRAKAYQDQMDREEELREMSRKMRKKDDERLQDQDSPVRSYR